jgi:hypothetical protein
MHQLTGHKELRFEVKTEKELYKQRRMLKRQLKKTKRELVKARQENAHNEYIETLQYQLGYYAGTLRTHDWFTES